MESPTNILFGLHDMCVNGERETDRQTEMESMLFSIKKKISELDASGSYL
jgi:hypothetical protein